MGAPIHEALVAHVPFDESEAAHRLHMLDFVARHEDPFDRRIVEGHLTGSAFVISHDGARTLLLHHKKLDRWLQPGGHAEAGERSGLDVAMREALEETRLAGLRLHPRAPALFDLDVHRIPARGDEPAHAHLDLRYLLVASEQADARHDPAESLALRWFTWAELATLEADPAMRRAFTKIERLLNS